MFKHYVKADAPDYGDGKMPVGTNSRKRAQRTDSMQEGAVQGSADIADADGLESRATDADTPSLPEGVSPGAECFENLLKSEKKLRLMIEDHVLHAQSAVTAEVVCLWPLTMILLLDYARTRSTSEDCVRLSCFSLRAYNLTKA